MEDVGGLLSVNTTKGDVVLLDGDLGAGKTCFSRGFIRGRMGACITNDDDTYDDDVRVTSPTYLLTNTYPMGDGSIIYHMDLYRLSGRSMDDMAFLNLENAFTHGICLIEWPSRLRTKPMKRLDIKLTIDHNSTIQESDDNADDVRGDDDDDDDSKTRFMQLVPHGRLWRERLKFLESEGYFDDLIV